MDKPADLTDPRTWLQVAEIKLSHARQILDIGLYDDAISRAYYAMFYAAKGALLREGLDLRKHSSAVAKFRELFVITGRVEADYMHSIWAGRKAPENAAIMRHSYLPAAKTPPRFWLRRTLS